MAWRIQIIVRLHLELYHDVIDAIMHVAQTFYSFQRIIWCLFIHMQILIYLPKENNIIFS